MSRFKFVSWLSGLGISILPVSFLTVLLMEQLGFDLERNYRQIESLSRWEMMLQNFPMFCAWGVLGFFYFKICYRRYQTIDSNPALKKYWLFHVIPQISFFLMFRTYGLVTILPLAIYLFLRGKASSDSTVETETAEVESRAA